MGDLLNNKNAVEAVHLAERIFGTNLLMAFIGGSRAEGTNNPDSDIDAFVVIAQDDRQNELRYATVLRGLHLDAGLQFDHYGEIFSYQTLDSLLRFTEAVVTTLPVIQKSPCYLGSCMLSAYRKGHIVFNFLKDAKIHVYDPGRLLAPLELRAQAYICKCDCERPEQADEIRLPKGTWQHRIATNWHDRLRDHRGTETPVGIGLERWFGSSLTKRLEYVQSVALPVAPLQGLDCPLPQQTTPDLDLYSIQCLRKLPIPS
ncbi:nucleotidyltransferase domain-containing protein [Nocardia fluminea]